MYYPPHRTGTNMSGDPAAISTLCVSLSQAGVEFIAGDLNAWNPIWSTSENPSGETNKRGDNVCNLLNSTDWLLATTPIPAFHRILSVGFVQSTPDLVLYRSHLRTTYEVQSPTADVTLMDLLAGGDHFPIWASVQLRLFQPYKIVSRRPLIPWNKGVSWSLMHTPWKRLRSILPQNDDPTVL